MPKLFIERAFSPKIVKEMFPVYRCKCNGTIYPYRKENAVTVLQHWFQCDQCKKVIQVRELKGLERID